MRSRSAPGSGSTTFARTCAPGSPPLSSAPRASESRRSSTRSPARSGWLRAMSLQTGRASTRRRAESSSSFRAEVSSWTTRACESFTSGSRTKASRRRSRTSPRSQLSADSPTAGTRASRAARCRPRSTTDDSRRSAGEATASSSSELAELDERLARRERSRARRKTSRSAGARARVELYDVATFAAPFVTVVVNAQSTAALFVSLPFGIRDNDPATVFESATVSASAVPSTRSYVWPSIVAARISPSYESASSSVPDAVSIEGDAVRGAVLRLDVESEVAPGRERARERNAAVFRPVATVHENERDAVEHDRGCGRVRDLDEATRVRADLVVVDLVDDEPARRRRRGRRRRRSASALELDHVAGSRGDRDRARGSVLPRARRAFEGAQRGERGALRSHRSRRSCRADWSCWTDRACGSCGTSRSGRPSRAGSASLALWPGWADGPAGPAGPGVPCLSHVTTRSPAAALRRITDDPQELLLASP